MKILFNIVFLCVINIIFMITGMILNSLVIINLWRSRQLRKQLCYFMILVLSCFDLAVVTFTHPVLITSTIRYYCREEIGTMLASMRIFILYTLYGFSMCCLFTLNAERFLALTCPYFHHSSVTKTRLLCFQAFWMTAIIGIMPLLYFNIETDIAGNIVSVVFVPLLLSFLLYGNYNMFKIAKSKHADERVSPSTATPADKTRKRRTLNVKNISTCSLVVGCFFFCFFPRFVYSVLQFTSGVSLYDRSDLILFDLWASTSVFI